MRTLIFLFTAILSNRVLPLIWQRDEFVGISWTGAAEWLITMSTYIPLLVILAITLSINYRAISAMSIGAGVLAAVALGAATAILFIPYDDFNNWRLTVFGYDFGFVLALGFLAAAIFLPRFLTIVESK